MGDTDAGKAAFENERHFDEGAFVGLGEDFVERSHGFAVVRVVLSLDKERFGLDKMALKKNQNSHSKDNIVLTRQ